MYCFTKEIPLRDLFSYSDTNLRKQLYIVNCQKACKKCDDGRACQRCIKLGLTATCVDSPRKERRKGIKRGPYKKRQPRAEQQQKQVSQQPSQCKFNIFLTD